MAAITPCPVCGSQISAESEALGGLCQHCLLSTIFKVDGDPATSGVGELFGVGEPEANWVPHLVGIAGHEIIEEIARGGMGIVFKARQSGLNRFVALKMMSAGQFAKPDDIARFRNEAEALARFRHPNLVPIYEVGEHDGLPWFSMEYIAGPSLSQELRNGPLLPERSARLLRAVAGAVEHAHDHGILHRDLKPSNILLAPGDCPMVTDFGLAKFVQLGADLTQTVGIVGSPGYMSPEQASGNPVDTRSDLYSLGVVLYEMLTGRPPFQSATPVRTIRLVIETEAVGPRRLNPGVPRDLETICLKCLAKDPARRYSTARELGDELGNYLENRPIMARPAGPAERIIRWCKKKPALATALFALALALGSGAGGVLWQWQRSSNLAIREVHQRKLAERNSYAADMLLIDRAMKDRNFGYASELLSRHEPDVAAGAPVQSDFRNWEWRYFQNQLPNDEASILGTCSNRVTTVAVSPDGQQVAAGDSDGTLKIWNLEPKKEIRQLANAGLIEHLRYSPDQRWLACGLRDGTTRLYRTVDWEVGLTFHSPRSAAPAFSSDGQNLYLASRGILTVHELVHGEQIRAEPLPVAAVLSMDDQARHLAMLLWSVNGCFLDLSTMTGVTNQQPNLTNRYQVSVTVSPDGRNVVGTYNDNAAWVWDFETGAVRYELQEHKGLIYRTAFSPDSRILATAGTDQVIGLWDVQTGKHLGILQGHRAAVTAVGFFPDGRRLVSGSRDRTVRIWDLGVTNQSSPSLVNTVASANYNFSPDGSLVWYGFSRKSWAVSDPFAGGEPLVEGHDPDVTFGVGDVHGGRFALAHDDGRISIWKRTNSTFVLDRSFPAHPGGVTYLAYSPDGRYLASVGQDRTSAIWSTTTDALLQRSAPEPRRDNLGPPRFSSDSEKLSQESQKEGSWVYEWRSGNWQGPFNGHTDAVTDSMVAPDGRHLSVVGHDGLVAIWELDHPVQAPRILGSPAMGIWATCYFPDGERLAVALDSGEIVIWDLVTGREVVRLFVEPIPFLNIAYNPEHDALVAANMRGIRVWKGRGHLEQRPE